MTTPISAPGTYGAGDYYLANDITVSGGTAITFTGPATLNLAGRRLKSTAGGIGIQGSAANNVAINGGRGSWIDGFEIGVNSSTPWTRVEGVIFDNITHIAATLSGHTSRFYDNVVNGVGGYTAEAYAVGANMGGDNSEVVGNEFYNIYRQPGVPASWIGEGCPIILNSAGHNTLVKDNLISNDTLQPHTIGVFAGGSGHIVQFNQMFNMNIGIQSALAAPGFVTAFKNTMWTPGGAGTNAILANYGLATFNVFGSYSVPVSGSIPNSNNPTF